jgi:hypothetical protein
LSTVAVDKLIDVAYFLSPYFVVMAVFFLWNFNGFS